MAVRRRQRCVTTKLALKPGVQRQALAILGMVRQQLGSEWISEHGKPKFATTHTGRPVLVIGELVFIKDPDTHELVIGHRGDDGKSELGCVFNGDIVWGNRIHAFPEMVMN
jgi:hypothetical protein